MSQVFWLQVRINRSFKRWPGKSAFLQPIGIFFSKIAQTNICQLPKLPFCVDHSTGTSCCVIYWSNHCFKMFQVVPCNQQFVFLPQWIFPWRINKSTAWVLNIFYHKSESKQATLILAAYFKCPSKPSSLELSLKYWKVLMRSWM